MKKSCIILLMSMIVVSLFGAIPQSQSNNGQNYINSSKAALDRKDYDESMRWAQRYINEYHSYAPLENIAEQMFQECKRIYPNDKKGFVKPLEYAARLGNVDAIFTLGMHYYGGQYITKDMDKGMALLKTAEKMGHPKAGSAYATIANGADWIAHKAKQQRYNDMIIGAVGLGALVAVAAAIIGNDNSSTSSSSSASSSSATSGTLNGHQWVNLGLPSGTKWAACNVGASYSTQYGNYYAWGEVWTKAIPNGYSERNYRFYESVTDNSVKITKYNTADNRTTIYDATEDAACALLGGDGAWVTPTRAQFQELIDYCDWSWTTVNDVNGYKVTSKKNGKTIFLPAGGHIESGFHPNKFSGTYMTRERNPQKGQRYIYVLYFNSTNKYVDDDWERSYGYLVRPVVARQ